ncbi:1-phosphofructokinase family hexose kinase [Psychromicrobium xiongbiense]|uniref:1-phosphofructokinase family hexose kinase n=1 Tax=Psychromicrobium xiongbiense TaxID=3051184 RepID=UPI002554358D|nr:hexose kinase [Psychromicrobium sp. YIM S02556]
MILTLTPNPAIDLTYGVAELVRGSSHRVDAPLSRAGGKGINVSRVLHSQGVPTKVLATAGGDTGRELSEGLAGLDHRLVPVQAPTRRTIALVDDHDGQTSIFNEYGAPLEAAEWRALASALAEELLGATVLVASGSLPQKAPGDFFPGVVALGRAAGIPVIVDTSGAALLSAASAGADLLKPNRAELAEATGEREVSAGARVLLGLGARSLLVSNGEEGMLLFTAGVPGYWSARLLEPLQGNPTGAGDAAVAGAASILAVAASQGVDVAPEALLARAAAWGSAAVLTPGAGEISPSWPELESTLQLSHHRSVD